MEQGRPRPKPTLKTNGGIGRAACYAWPLLLDAPVLIGITGTAKSAKFFALPFEGITAAGWMQHSDGGSP